MKTLTRIVVVLAIGAAAVYGVRHLTRAEPVEVRLAPVERGLVERVVANTRAGTVMACRRAKLAPATGGQVVTLTVSEGTRVQTGTLLMSLWNEDLQAELALARTQVQVARSSVEEACLTAEVAEREARRLQRLAKQDVVSEEQVDRATTVAGAKGAACQGAGASMEVSKARVRSAEAAIERTLLVAPFAGVVAEVNAELGEFVTPSPPGIATPPAVDLIDDGCLYVSAPIDEVDAPAIRTGMPACVSLDAFPERRCGARVRRVAPYVRDQEKQARTVDVELDLSSEADAQGLLPGYTADVEIVLESRDGVLRIPTEAVLEGYRVLVLPEGGGVLESRAFTPGLANWQHTEVTDGLDEGERVVVSVDRDGVVAGALAVPERAAPEPHR